MLGKGLGNEVLRGFQFLKGVWQTGMGQGEGTLPFAMYTQPAQAGKRWQRTGELLRRSGGYRAAESPERCSLAALRDPGQ